MNLELHPLCTLFPRMTGEAFDSLVADIASNGQREPIVIHEGMILDGGNRYRACMEAGIEPKVVEFNGGSIVSFVLSANLHRRHMTPGQQAAIVAAAQDWAQAQTQGRPKQSDHLNTLLDTTASRAAQSGASVMTQRRADQVAKADPELARKVAHGEVSLPAAVEKVSGKRPGAKPKPEPEPVERDDLQEAIDALSEENDRLLAENRTLRMAASPDALKEIERLKEYQLVIERQRDEWMNQCAQLKREVKALRRRLGE